MPTNSPWNVARVAVKQPLRGLGSQTEIEFDAQSISLTWSWGSQPAEGMINYVADGDFPEITSGAYLEISLFGKTFYGVAKAGPAKDINNKVIPTTQSSRGRNAEVAFADTRYYLSTDTVFCAFNKSETRIVNGVRVRRYWHIFPEHFQRWRKTWTDTAYSAAQIIQFILRYHVLAFPASVPPALGSVWTPALHPAQNAFPVYDIDALSGKRLDELLQEISDKQGLVFTLMGGPFTLVWARKGEGILPSIPANVEDQQLGFQLSGAPTRISVVGDRNLYLVLDVALAPDWNRAWEGLFILDRLADDLFNFATDPGTGVPYNGIAGDVEQAVGRQLAAARAREITVGQYASLRLARDGVDFRDYRLFGGRSRMEIPAALYIDHILFRAFRPPTTINFNGEAVPVESLELTNEAVARVTHNVTTGKMTAHLTEVTGGNGYAIVRGFRVGAEIFQAIAPERFRLDDFNRAADLWQPISFQIDDSGESGRYLLFDEPVIKLQGLISTLDGYGVLNANPAFDVPEVRAALTFAGDRFLRVVGSGSIDGHVNVNGLRMEFIVNNGALTEVPSYADGLSANAKADEIGSTLLAQPYFFYKGSYRRQLNFEEAVPDLTAMINRITLESSAQGHFYTLEFTAERPSSVYTPERDFDRRVRQTSLLPGQQELREEAHTLRLIAGALHQSPGFVRRVGKALAGRLGVHAAVYPVFIANGSGNLPAGTPLWKEPNVLGTNGLLTKTRAVMPSAVASAHTEFAGVTQRNLENATGTVRVQREGKILVRVKGKCAMGDTLVREIGADYLVKSNPSVSAPAAAVAQQAIDSEVVQLITAVTSGAGGGSANGNPVEVDICQDGVSKKLIVLAVGEPF